MEQDKYISIAAVAEACGVSVMTVSRALRGATNIRQETRNKVLAAANEMGYFRSGRAGRPPKAPDEAPRIQLLFGATRETPTVFHARLLGSLERRLAELGYDCLIRSSNGDYRTFLRLLETARKTDATATIILGDFPDEQLIALLGALPGALLLDHPGLGNEAFYSSIAFDNVEAGRLGTRFLLDRNCRKILLLCGDAAHFFARELTTGFREVHAERNIPLDEKLICHSDFTADGAAEALAECLDKKLEFDAIFTNDEMATGVYRLLAQRRIRIPEDLKICGCDNLPIGLQMVPALTTIGLNYDHLALQAVRSIERSRTEFVPMRARLMPALIVRESV